MCLLCLPLLYPLCSSPFRDFPMQGRSYDMGGVDMVMLNVGERFLVDQVLHLDLLIRPRDFYGCAPDPSPWLILCHLGTSNRFFVLSRHVEATMPHLRRYQRRFPPPSYGRCAIDLHPEREAGCTNSKRLLGAKGVHSPRGKRFAKLRFRNYPGPLAWGLNPDIEQARVMAESL